MWAVSYLAAQPGANVGESTALFDAVVNGDVEGVRDELQKSTSDINALEPSSGSSPLCTAVFLGRTEIAQMLLAAGADINQPNRDKATPMHIAVFMARPEEAEMLLEAGADTTVRDGTGALPQDLLNIDFGTTNYLASMLGVPLEEQQVLAGRKQIAELFGEKEYLGSGPGGKQAADLAGLKSLLFQFPVFMHLWFLAFLCWLVMAFLLYAVIAKWLRIERIPSLLVCSPVNLLWLIPITMLPQSFMQTGSFGPDASVGLLPIPSVLLYYAVFFFFGAVYWDMDDKSGQLGRRWYVSLAVALLVVFPVGLDVVFGSFEIVPRIADEATTALIGNFLQATFAWLMTFGSIGLFRRLLSGENSTLRYISDSSYWLYLAHLPLVVLAQWLVRDLPIPAFVKFTLITVAVSGFLLLTYEYGVRYTFIGRLLNGPRTRSTV